MTDQPEDGTLEAAWEALAVAVTLSTDEDRLTVVYDHRDAIEAAIRGTTPLDADTILPLLPDDADLDRQFRAGWFAARQALAAALRGQPSEPA